MLNYNKSEIRESITLDNVFELLQEWGGDPEYTSFGIISTTICHNKPGEGSKKLYYYSNSSLFNCYTDCGGSFDIFELTIKIFNIQYHQEYDLNSAVRWIAFRLGISASYQEDEGLKLIDWEILDKYQELQNLEVKDFNIILKEYDSQILDRLNYTLKIQPWLDEGISQEAMNQARIGFFPGGDQITIPHYDKDGRFIGLRGRTVCQEDAERYGKYRPLKINTVLYNHPLGMNLYNLNFTKDNINFMKKAIVFESEKSNLLYKSYFGIENDISVACCGSNISMHQVHMLLEAGAQEIVIAFDRQFQEIGDPEFKRLIMNFKKIYNKYKNMATISFMFDKNKITQYKASPIDEGPEKFMKLFKERVLL